MRPTYSTRQVLSGYNVKYITGYQVQTALGGWVCTPAQREVTITLTGRNGFSGDVALSVDAPDGIKAELERDSSGTSGDRSGQVTGARLIFPCFMSL